jgi:hypothetical protein
MTTTYADGTTNTEYSDRSIITYPMVLPLRRGYLLTIKQLNGSVNI